MTIKAIKVGGTDIRITFAAYLHAIGYVAQKTYSRQRFVTIFGFANIDETQA